MEILGMDSAYAEAKESVYGANMTISAALVVELVDRISGLEKALHDSAAILGGQLKELEAIAALLCNPEGSKKGDRGYELWCKYLEVNHD